MADGHLRAPARDAWTLTVLLALILGVVAMHTIGHHARPAASAAPCHNETDADLPPDQSSGLVAAGEAQNAATAFVPHPAGGEDCGGQGAACVAVPGRTTVVATSPAIATVSLVTDNGPRSGVSWVSWLPPPGDAVGLLMARTSVLRV